MKKEEILQKLSEAKKGTYIKLTKIKDYGSGCVKESDLVMRIGVSYANMKINENKQTGELPWGHWLEGFENLVVEHKGNLYIRVATKDPKNPELSTDVLATRYLLNGEEVNKETIASIIGEKKMTSKPSTVYNIKFENIVKIGK